MKHWVVRAFFICICAISTISFLISSDVQRDELNERFAISSQLKVLHLSFHKGCIREIEGVAKALGLELTSWYILGMPAYSFDPESSPEKLYNIGHDRAERIWNTHKHFFNAFDVVIVSDTAPLARIFLQNNFHKKLVIWISDRFDYCDRLTQDCDFPDNEFYELFNKANTNPNVKIVGTCAYEHFYARKKGVETGSRVIKPCAPYIENVQHCVIPADVNKANTFFLPSYHNETLYMDLRKKCTSIGIPCYRGSFAGPRELEGFKGVIHLPYSWSTIALYVNTQLGLPYFIPSKKFLKTMNKTSRYWHQDCSILFDENKFALSEWYSSYNKELITYFDSWDDLKKKIVKTDFVRLKKKVQAHALQHKERQLTLWNELFEEIVAELDQ